MKVTTLTLCTALFLFSCQNNSKVVDQTKSEQKEPYFKPDFKYVQQTPDSLRTPEQKELINKIQKVLAENTGAENNEMVFKLSKEEFVAKGIPVEYYDLIQKDLINNNKMLKEQNVNVDSMMKAQKK